ncbi:hypothetical protein IWZ01DRAFT_571967 [Phyllosticta capitalensis]
MRNRSSGAESPFFFFVRHGVGVDVDVEVSSRDIEVDKDNAEAVRCPSVRAVRRAGQAAGQAISLSADRHDFLSIQTSIPQPKHLRCTIPGFPAPFSRLVSLISPHFGPRCRPQFRFFTPLSAPPAACSNEPASRTPSPASPSPHKFHASRPVILLDPRLPSIRTYRFIRPPAPSAPKTLQGTPEDSEDCGSCGSFFLRPLR